MKKFIKILSVILCVAVLISSVSILSFAEDEVGEEPTETVEVVEEETPAPVKETYESFLMSHLVEAMLGMTAIVAFPAGIAGISLAMTPTVILLPVTLPVAAVAGAVVSVGSLLYILASPVISLFEYVSQ